MNHEIRNQGGVGGNAGFLGRIAVPVCTIGQSRESSVAMTGLTEMVLRNGATWQAFKEGKSLFESGMVTGAEASESGWKGGVRMGNKLLRVAVVMKSVSHLETRCPCADNQRNGSVCCHAVATGLAIIARSAVSAGQGGAERAMVKVPPVAVVQPRAWQILLPLNWREALCRGKFAATLALAEGEEVFPADERLSNWLSREKVAAKSILSLNLDGVRVPAFLESIAEHPRLAAGKERLSIGIRSGERLQLADVQRLGEEIVLTPQVDLGQWVEIAGSFWQISPGAILRMGMGGVPGELLPMLSTLAGGNGVEISVGKFFNQLEAWQEWVVFPQDGWLEGVHFIPARASIELNLEGSLNQLEAELKVRYDGAAAAPLGLGKVECLPRLAGERCEVRDLVTEEAAVARFAKAGFTPVDYSNGRWVLQGESAVLDFLSRSLPILRKEWVVQEGQRFAQVQKQVSLVSPKIEIRGSGNDWLSFTLSFQTDAGTEVPAAEIRRLLRSGKGAAGGLNGKRLILSDDIAEVIDPLFSDLDLRQENGNFIASSIVGELVKEIQNKLSKSFDSNKLVDHFEFEKPESLRAELRPYQTQGVGWMLDRIEKYGGALLADDMGLGKTVQTIALIERIFLNDQERPGIVMVVATTSLLGNWKAEFGRFAPQRKVRILHGSGRDVERDRVNSGEVILTSYGTLARDLAWHLKQDYRAVVIDEASLIRNPDTDHSKALAKLKAARRIALTGTPVENGVRDLWSIFRFIQPGWLGGREDFKEKYELPLSDAATSGGVMERLRLKTSPFLLRRTKEQVAPELPSKLLIDEYCDLSADQQAVYKQLLVEGQKRIDAIADSGNAGAARMQMLTALLRLRQTCCDLALLGNDRFNQLLIAKRSSKLLRALELLEEALAGGHRVLIFSQFQKQLREIEKCIAERGWESLRLDGQTRNRQQLVDRFQKAGGPPIFLISLKAGGYGLNLTAADIVIHFDPWWNPAAEAQATDRAHRIGQTRPVTVYRLLTRGTVEEKVIRLQSKKRELASAIDDESGAGEAVGWSMDDLKSVILG